MLVKSTLGNDLTNRIILLNGNELQLTSDDDLPNLDPGKNLTSNLLFFFLALIAYFVLESISKKKSPKLVKGICPMGSFINDVPQM
jgi:hypothetical protein